MSEELRGWEKEAIENGELEAEWTRGLTPVARNPRMHTFIKWAGVNYGKELPERLKEAGVHVVNEREDVE